MVATVLVLALLGSFLGRRAALQQLKAESERCDLELRRIEYVLEREQQLHWQALELAARLRDRGVEADVSDLREGWTPPPPHPPAPPDDAWPGRMVVERWRQSLAGCRARVDAGLAVENGLPALERRVAELMADVEASDAPAGDE